MGKGAKKPSRLVKPEKQEKTKKFEKEEEPPISLHPPSVPSPIPEEVESGYAAQGSVHGDDNPTSFTATHWDVSGPTVGAWRASGSPSHVASPRRSRDFPDSGVPDTHSQETWGGRSPSTVSFDPQRKHYRSSPHPGQAGDLGSDFERDVPGSNDEIKLDYISEGHSRMSPSYSTDQHWDTAAQPNPPQTQPQAQPSGPSFGVYATSLSNRPVPPDPLPAPPNVVSKASDAAARLDKSKKVDIPMPPQSQYVPPSGPAMWHSWIKPGVYKPSVEPPAPPPAPQAPPLPHMNMPAFSGMPASVLKGSSSHLPRGIWETRNSKDGSMSAFGQQPKPMAHGAATWGQPGMSADSLSGYQVKGNYGGWNDSGWNQPSNGNWPDGGKKGHGRSKSVGAAWGGKRNVQWEEEEEDDESDETDDDSWGEEGEAEGVGGWEPINKKDTRWTNSEGGHTGMGWPKQDNGWGGSAVTGWNQGGLNQGAGNWGGQSGLGGERKVEHKEHFAAEMTGTVSPQQRTQILNSLINITGQKQAGQGTQGLQRSKHMSKKNKQEKENKRQPQYSTGWGLEDDSWGNGQEDDGKADEHKTRSSSSKRASTAWDAWGGAPDASRYSMPSLTMSYAYKDSKTRLDPGFQSKFDDVTKMRFHESKGVALQPVHNALFSQSRLARDRIHWSFPPDKDERVRAALTWIQEMSYGLGTFALHKFLQHRERGALIINADYNPPDRPKDFAIDYLIFDDLQKSFDKTLQSSVISYDPTLQAIVFIFLPSKSGNSVAIWRRKLIVPNNARLRFQPELDIALAGLKEPKSYGVYIDEVPKKKKDLPDAPEPPEEVKPKKRKWWHFFKSKS